MLGQVVVVSLVVTLVLKRNPKLRTLTRQLGQPFDEP